MTNTAKDNTKQQANTKQHKTKKWIEGKRAERVMQVKANKISQDKKRRDRISQDKTR